MNNLRAGEYLVYGANTLGVATAIGVWKERDFASIVWSTLLKPIGSIIMALAFASLVSGCGGGGGNPGTCNGSAEVCGRNTGGTVASVDPIPGTSIICSGSLIRADEYCVVYSVTGTTDQVSLTYTFNGAIAQESAGLPWSKEQVLSRETFLYLSAQNQRNTGSVAVSIKVNGSLFRSDQTFKEYGIATASGSYPESTSTATTATTTLPVITPTIAFYRIPDNLFSSLTCPQIKSLNGGDQARYLASAQDAYNRGKKSLDGDNDGIACNGLI